MKFFAPYIRRVYRTELLKAESKGYDRARAIAKAELNKALDEQRDVFELKLISKNNDIVSLEKTIKYMERQVNDAGEKIKRSKQIYLEARKIITMAENSFKRHTENETRVMTEFSDIRIESELFEKNLIGE